GKVFSRNQIIERINGSQYFATERSVDVQVAGLRKKLDAYKDVVETVRSVGYRFNQRLLV
ncbi:MAG TPA: winged helix-turn-helix domain-containing protein, partial [Mucilaginibacter sp.]|nr:winged helix-turn-helix domain-containing protein [Mucilaginibacter sp.]